MRTVTKRTVAKQSTRKRALVSQFENLKPPYISPADTSTITPLRRVKTGAVAEFSVQRVLTCISIRYWRQITMPVALAAVWQVAPPDTFLCWAALPLFSIIGRMVRNWLVLDLPNMRIRTHWRIQPLWHPAIPISSVLWAVRCRKKCWAAAWKTGREAAMAGM